MKTGNGIQFLLNRFTVAVVSLTKETGPDIVFYRGCWEKGTVCLEPVEESQRGQHPVMVMFTGYGVVEKACAGKIDWAERVTAGDEFFWEWKDAGEERQLVFVRRDVVVPWLEKREEEGWAVVAVSLSSVVEETVLKTWISQTYRQWQTWKYWRKVRKEQQVIATFLLKRLKWPVLLFILLLSGSGYYLQTVLQREVLQQQEELLLWQRKIQLHRHDKERRERMSRMLGGNGKLAPLFDRIAAAVPRRVTLTRLEANPPERRVEAGKPLVLKKGYLLVEGYTPDSAEVALFTENLSEAGYSWQVMLESLDYQAEKTEFAFRISIVWQTDKKQKNEAE